MIIFYTKIYSNLFIFLKTQENNSLVNMLNLLKYFMKIF